MSIVYCPSHFILIFFILFQLNLYEPTRGQQSIDSHHHWDVDDWRQRNLLDDIEHYTLYEDDFDQLLAAQSDKNQNNYKFKLPLTLQVSETRRSITLNSNNKPENDSKNAKLLSNLECGNCQTLQNFTLKNFKKDSNTNKFNIPKSSLGSIRKFFQQHFSTVRNHENDLKNNIKIKRNLRDKFREFGLTTIVQKFQAKTKSLKKNSKPRQPITYGHNIIGILPGINRGKDEKKDSIVVIGAHMDTVTSSPGVDDNGSGATVILELARLLTQYKCQLNTTIIFVLFDLEEYGLFGSKHFVKNYLFQEENRNNIKFVLIMDMVLEYDPRPHTQSPQPFNTLLPDFDQEMNRNEYRGDFLGCWARENIDIQFFKHLKQNWQNEMKYKLYLMAAPIPAYGRQLNQGFLNGNLKKYSVFLRSDHASFWYPDFYKNMTITNTILLTDLGPWRRNIADKYHTFRDNTALLTNEKIRFLQNTVDSILATLLNISDGKCMPF